MQNARERDIHILEGLNRDIGDYETRAARARLAGVVAPRLAFQRADGKTFDDRSRFLKKVKKSPSRTTRVESIQLWGDRAVVACVVTLASPTGDEDYHNLRMFVRIKGQWKLLGWANESV